MKALIVDDERLARNELRRLLASHPEIEIAGEARDAFEAATLIRAMEPELLFLDIQMPERNGFELLEQLDDVPLVIFTTAYDQYAIQAFEVSALDYLLKPVTPDRLASALAKFPMMPETAPLVKPERIFVRDGERCWFVSVADIAVMESEGNYARLYFGDSRPLLPRSLKYLEERLDVAMFFRASRKHILNLREIASLDPWVNGGLLVKMKNGIEIGMSRRRSQVFKELMSL